MDAPSAFSGGDAMTTAHDRRIMNCWSIVFIFLPAFAMSMDFPKSKSRFSRLSG